MSERSDASPAEQTPPGKGPNRGLRRREVLGLGLGGLAAAALGGFEWISLRSGWSVAFWDRGEEGRLTSVSSELPEAEGPLRLQLMGVADDSARKRWAQLRLEVKAEKGAPGFDAWALPSRAGAPVPPAVSVRSSERPVLTVHSQRAEPGAELRSEPLPISLPLREGVYFGVSNREGSPDLAACRVMRTGDTAASLAVVDRHTGEPALPGRVWFALVVEAERPVEALSSAPAAPSEEGASLELAPAVTAAG
jgi:hypothetical protein